MRPSAVARRLLPKGVQRRNALLARLNILVRLVLVYLISSQILCNPTQLSAAT